MNQNLPEIIQAKRELIFEYPNLLDRFTIDFVEHSLINYPLSYGHTAFGTQESNFFFGRVFYWDGFKEEFNANNLPSGVDYIVDYTIRRGTTLIHPDAIFRGIHRVVLNGQTQVNTPSIHPDTNSALNQWSFLYYITANASGGTMIYNNLKDQQPFHLCPYEQGKFLIFPSVYTHQALPPESKDHWRMTLNVVLEIESPLSVF